MVKNNKETVLLMLSGGLDSFLSACKLIEDGYNIKMVSYDNGCTYGSDNIKIAADRIIKKYGEDRAEYFGSYKTAGVVREFFFPYFNMTPAKQQEEYDGLTPSQFHCLICRMGMYIYSIWICKKYDIHYIAEGARKSQEFVIELPGMIKERIPALLKDNGIELLLPVYEMEDDWERSNELLARGFVPIANEGKCLIGVPVNGSIDESVVSGVHKYYDRVILNKIKELDLLNEDNYNRYLDLKYDELK